MIVNLTPHPIRVYGWQVPDRIQIDGEHEPIQVFAPSGTVARLVELEIGGREVPGASFSVEQVQYGQAEGLPQLTADIGDTWHIVSLPLALAMPYRPDLLVPYREVRNMEGTVIGCRALARPV